MLRLINLTKAFCTANTPSKHRYYFKHAFHIVPHPEKAHKGG